MTVEVPQAVLQVVIMEVIEVQVQLVGVSVVIVLLAVTEVVSLLTSIFTRDFNYIVVKCLRKEKLDVSIFFLQKETAFISKSFL